MPKKKEKVVIIGYRDTPETKRELMLLAARLGHGKVAWVIRDAVTDYLKRHRKLAKAG